MLNMMNRVASATKEFLFELKEYLSKGLDGLKRSLLEMLEDFKKIEPVPSKPVEPEETAIEVSKPVQTEESVPKSSEDKKIEEIKIDVIKELLESSDDIGRVDYMSALNYHTKINLNTKVLSKLYTLLHGRVISKSKNHEDYRDISMGGTIEILGLLKNIVYKSTCVYVATKPVDSFISINAEEYLTPLSDSLEYNFNVWLSSFKSGFTLINRSFKFKDDVDIHEFQIELNKFANYFFKASLYSLAKA